MRRRAYLVLLVFAATVAAGALSGCSSPTAPAGPGGPSGPPAAKGAPEGTAQVSGGAQSISVDVSQGFYDPTVIHAKAGMPLEITFGQGQGCLARVLFPDFGIDQDLTQGGAVVRLPAMKAGEYEFSCGMRMVFGKLVVQ